MSNAPTLGTIWNGSVVHVVPTGTIVEDPNGKKPPVTVDDQTVAFAGRALYCTASTEAKLIARIEEMQAKRSSHDDEWTDLAP